MPSISSAFASAANALGIIEQALGVAQNNVDNASTAGYSRQALIFQAQPLDLAAGQLGGLASGGLQDSRNVWLEEQVQGQTSALGKYSAQAQSTDTVQAAFDVSGTGGITSALSGLLQNFSAWASTPSDSTARQNVLNGAQNVAQAINTLSNTLGLAAGQLNSNITDTVSQINNLAASIQQYNVTRSGNEQDANPGAEAQLYSSLESLSSLVDFTAVRQTDGTVTVLLSGGTPLVVGGNQYALDAATTPQGAAILNSNGQDITSQIDSGQLGGLLDARNNTLASIIGTSTSTGTLNQFAETLADTINGILTTGSTSSDPNTAVAGSPLFTYNPAAAASTFAVTGITVDQLAPVDAQGNSNGNANALAALGNSNATLAQLGGMTLLGYFGQIAANAGRANQTATQNQSTQQQVLAQAKSLRDQASGVNLDEEAANVMQFQRAYQAVAEVLTVLNTLADSVLGIIPPA